MALVLLLSLCAAPGCSDSTRPPAQAETECYDFAGSMHWVTNLKLNGAIKTVLVHEDHLYALRWRVGKGKDLLTFDISDRSRPKLVSTVYVGWSASGLAVSGSTLVVSGGPGLRIYYIANPGMPEHIQTLDISGRWTRALAVDNNMAFIGHETGFVIADISEYGNARVVSNMPLEDEANAIVVRDSLAYIGSDNHGFYVVGVADPAAPELRGRNFKGADVSDLGIVDDVVYATGRQGIHSYDVQDPEHPIYMQNLIGLHDSGEALAIEGSRVLVAARWMGLVVADARSPLQFEALGVEFAAGVVDIDHAGEYVYMACSTMGLSVVKLGSNPGHEEPPGSAQIGGDVRLLESSGDLLVAALSTREIATLSGSELSPMGSLPINAKIEGLSLRGRQLAVATDHDLQLVDVSDPSSPRLAAALSIPGTLHDVSLHDDHVYVAGSKGLRRVDLGPFRALDTRWAIDPDVCMTSLCVTEDLLIVGAYQSEPELRIYRRNEGSEPVLEARISVVDEYWGGFADVPDSVKDIFIEDGIAYIASQLGGLILVDIAQSHAPRIIKRVPMPNASLAVEVADHVAYVGSGVAGVSVVDASVPESAAVVGDGGKIWIDSFDVAVSGRVLLSAAGTRGIKFFGIGCR